MIIINADDWGRTSTETDAALACFKAGRITSVSAMVFMADSERAAGIAKCEGIDVGLHLNLNECFTSAPSSRQLVEDHGRVVRFLKRSKYCQLIYNPGLSKVFPRVFQTQYDEFVRLYDQRPSHVDGHQHMHLCANMWIDAVIPKGERVRRNFSFWPGEKSFINRSYRQFLDSRLARRYRMTDYFVALSQNMRKDRLSRVAGLAQESSVELMTHPAVANEYDLLMSEGFSAVMQGLDVKPYTAI